MARCRRRSGGAQRHRDRDVRADGAAHHLQAARGSWLRGGPACATVRCRGRVLEGRASSEDNEIVYARPPPNFPGGSRYRMCDDRGVPLKLAAQGALVR
eukprot:4204858-Prymnesium_polylepis.2